MQLPFYFTYGYPFNNPLGTHQWTIQGKIISKIFHLNFPGVTPTWKELIQLGHGTTLYHGVYIFSSLYLLNQERMTVQLTIWPISCEKSNSLLSKICSPSVPNNSTFSETSLPLHPSLIRLTRPPFNKHSSYLSSPLCHDL